MANKQIKIDKLENMGTYDNIMILNELSDYNIDIIEKIKDQNKTLGRFNAGPTAHKLICQSDESDQSISGQEDNSSLPNNIIYNKNQ